MLSETRALHTSLTNTDRDFGLPTGPFVQWNVTPEMANAAAKSFAEFMREFQGGPNPWGNPAGQRRPDGRQQQNPWKEAMNAATLPLDVEEQSASYVVSADVPGLQKADLKVGILGQYPVLCLNQALKIGQI